jgi:hypothetical protein
LKYAVEDSPPSPERQDTKTKMNYAVTDSPPSLEGHNAVKSFVLSSSDQLNMLRV